MLSLPSICRFTLVFRSDVQHVSKSRDFGATHCHKTKPSLFLSLTSSFFALSLPVAVHRLLAHGSDGHYTCVVELLRLCVGI